MGSSSWPTLKPFQLVPIELKSGSTCIKYIARGYVNIFPKIFPGGMYFFALGAWFCRKNCPEAGLLTTWGFSRWRGVLGTDWCIIIFSRNTYEHTNHAITNNCFILKLHGQYTCHIFPFGEMKLCSNQLTVLLREVWLYFGNFFPWPFKHPKRRWQVNFCGPWSPSSRLDQSVSNSAQRLLATPYFKHYYFLASRCIIMPLWQFSSLESF